MYPTHAVSTTTTIKSSLHKIHSCAYCTYANQAYYSQLRMLLSDNQKTIRRWASTKCTPVYITHQMNAQRARLRPAYYSLATAGGANKITHLPGFYQIPTGWPPYNPTAPSTNKQLLSSPTRRAYQFILNEYMYACLPNR